MSGRWRSARRQTTTYGLASTGTPNVTSQRSEPMGVTVWSVAGVPFTLHAQRSPGSKAVISNGTLRPTKVVTVPVAPSSNRPAPSVARRTDGPHSGQRSRLTSRLHRSDAGASMIRLVRYILVDINLPDRLDDRSFRDRGGRGRRHVTDRALRSTASTPGCGAMFLTGRPVRRLGQASPAQRVGQRPTRCEMPGCGSVP